MRVTLLSLLPVSPLPLILGAGEVTVLHTRAGDERNDSPSQLVAGAKFELATYGL